VVKAGRHFTRGGALYAAITSGRRFQEEAANIGEIAVALDNLRTVATKLNDSTIQINISF
jgi:hypothetical protein